MPRLRRGRDVTLPCGHRYWATHDRGERVVSCLSCPGRYVVRAVPVHAIDYLVEPIPETKDTLL